MVDRAGAGNRPRVTEVTLRGWRGVVTNTLADKVGILADLVISESLDALGMSEDDMRLSSLNRFLIQVYQQLPDDVDKGQLVRKMQTDLLKQLYVALRRDLFSRLDRI